MTAIYTPSAPGDAEDWRTSPDLLTLEDKLTAALGPADEPTRAWEAASLLLIGTANCEQVTW